MCTNTQQSDNAELNEHCNKVDKPASSMISGMQALTVDQYQKALDALVQEHGGVVQQRSVYSNYALDEDEASFDTGFATNESFLSWPQDSVAMNIGQEGQRQQSYASRRGSMSSVMSELTDSLSLQHISQRQQRRGSMTSIISELSVAMHGLDESESL